MNRSRADALEHLAMLVSANEAMVGHQGPVSQLTAELRSIAASPGDPYLVVDCLLQGVVQMITGRIPLERQRAVASAVEMRLSDALSAWELK